MSIKFTIFHWFWTPLLILQIKVVNTHNMDACLSKIYPSDGSDIDSLKIYPDLNFKAKWTRDHKHFWKSTDFDFETRYNKQLNHGAKWKNKHRYLDSTKASKETPQVKVFLLPFSHNDPGWKETFETYFYSLTKKILNNAISKLSEHKNMTFAWSEVSFLSKWWDEASLAQKGGLQRLVKEGRFEILTGGWVMADEATTTVFGLVKQLVEGHQWINRHLNTLPTSAWSIDAFGHGSTMPYLLKQSGITGMMIQRVNYAWKHWFAEHRQGDFIWTPRWSSNQNEDGILCHNAHFDLYPTKHACGPVPNTCMRFDFRMVEDLKEEHLKYIEPVNPDNTLNLADSLVGQYGRTASLTKHNVVISSLGGDFRFEHRQEWDQQYGNYKLLFDFINSHPKDYSLTANFGTLSDYFQAVKETNVTLSTFFGDFFPYTDIIFPFAPGYWTGFYATRPFWKKLDRETEDELMKAETLFTFSYNLLRQHNHSTEVLFRNYDNLVHARRSLALFQHHDGITGTSPRNTMLDFARKLTQAWNFCRQIQRLSIESIWRKYLNIPIPPLVSEIERESYTASSNKAWIKLYENANIVKKVIIYNNLPWKRSQLVRLSIVGNNKNVAVKDPNGNEVVSQINTDPTNRSYQNEFELLFTAELSPLSVVTYEICQQKTRSLSEQSTTSCKNCKSENDSVVIDKKISLSNRKIKVYFDANLGLITRIEQNTDSDTLVANVTLSFGRYDAMYGSGAYLLHPFTSSEHSILNADEISVYVQKGPVTSEVTLVTPKYKLKSWILHQGMPEMLSVVYMSLDVNGTITDLPGEYYMRFQSDLNNTEKSRLENITEFLPEKNRPVIFTDTNGFSVEKRVTFNKLPYQAHVYPITQLAFIQDTIKQVRLSLLTDRSQGVTSAGIRGRLETLFDRRLRYDDARGMDEGVMDPENTVQNYILNLEHIPTEFANDNNVYSWQPSLSVQKLAKYLNHQPTIFLYDALYTHESGEISLFSHEVPDDVYLLNLQTLSGSENQEDIKSVPSTKALMILQKLSYFNNTRPNHSRAYPGKDTMDSCHYQDSSLNTTIHLNHSVKRTNLVGTMEHGVNENGFEATATSPTTKTVSTGKPHELSAYLIQF